MGNESQNYLNANDLIFKTNHLQNYADLDTTTEIFGNSYKPLKKLLWYQLTGLPLIDRLIQIGKVYQDTRVQSLLPIPSGKGKLGFKLATKKIVESLGLNAVEPTSLHPEQLIGKMIRERVEKKWEWIENRGYLADDVLQFDEAYRLLSDDDGITQESRRYIKIAADPFYKNNVTKKLVEHSSGHTLAYCPRVVCQFFFQPLRFEEIIMLDGFMRRFYFPYVNLQKIDNRANYLERLKNTKNTGESVKGFASFLAGVKTSVGTGWTFTDAAVNEIISCHAALEELGNARGVKSSNFTDIMGFTLQDNLIKLSCILAGSTYRNKVDDFHVKLAFLDYAEFYTLMLEFVEEKIFGLLDYGKGWKGAISKSKQCLEWLFEQDAVSIEKSNITINDFLGYIAEVFGVKTDQARNKLRSFESKEWVESRQVGQDSSKVWLAFEPQTEGLKGCKGWNYYNTILDGYEHLIDKLLGSTGEIYPFTNSNPSSPSNPLDLSLKADKQCLQAKTRKRKRAEQYLVQSKKEAVADA